MVARMGWWGWLNLAAIILLLAGTAAWLWERESARRRRLPEPDDPRVAEFAAELAAAWGASGERPPVSDAAQVEAFVDELMRARYESREWNHMLVWSGPLPAGVEEEAAVNALVQARWWHFNGRGELREVEDEARVIKQLTRLIGITMAYDVEVMPEARAAELAAEFVSLPPESRRWFTNFDGELGDAWAFTPLTDFTFDAGFIAVADGRAWVAWFTDDD